MKKKNVSKKFFLLTLATLSSISLTGVMTYAETTEDTGATSIMGTSETLIEDNSESSISLIDGENLLITANVMQSQTDKPGNFEFEVDWYGDLTIKPIKVDGSIYTGEGTRITIPGVHGEHTLNSEGILVIENADLPLTDITGLITIQEVGKEISEGVTFTTPKQKLTTETPKLTEFFDDEGNFVLKLLKLNGEFYDEGTKLSLDFEDGFPGGTYYTNESSEIVILNNHLPSRIVETRGNVKEGNSFSSSDIYITLPAKREVTVRPWSVNTSQKFNGDLELKIFKQYNVLYLPGTVVRIEGFSEEFEIQSNGKIIIPNEKLPNASTISFMRVIEPGKIQSRQMGVSIYSKK